MPSVAVAFDHNPFAIVFDHKIDPVTDSGYLRAGVHAGSGCALRRRRLVQVEVRFLDLLLVGNFWCAPLAAERSVPPHHLL